MAKNRVPRADWKHIQKLSPVCVDCKFYVAVNDTQGVCRRYPPQMVGTSSYFPPVSNDFWCGEFGEKVK